MAIKSMILCEQATTYLPSFDVLHDLLLARQLRLFSPVRIAIRFGQEQGNEMNA